MHRLAAVGRLDGRLVAVGGYWAQVAIPCPFAAHQAVLDAFCSGGQFADTPEAARNFGDINSTGVPIAVPETSNGDVLWSAVGPNGDPVAVVLIVHGADGRAGQCEAIIRAGCQSRLVIDDVAWVSGQQTALNPDTSALPAVALTLDDVIAAGVKPGEQVVTAYPLLATDLNDVDPRLLGQGSGIVWYLRVLTGTPDGDAISDGMVRLVSDSSSAVGAELPLVVPDDYAPARLVLDSRLDFDKAPNIDASFTLRSGGATLAQGSLDSGTMPLALQAGGYSVGAFLADRDGNQFPRPTCELQLTVTGGADLAYTAVFAATSCAWAPTQSQL